METEISLTPEILSSVKRALDEDIGIGDATSESIVPIEATVEARVISKEVGVVAGISVLQTAFKLLDTRVNFSSVARVGERVPAGQILLEITGRARGLLSTGRPGANFFGRTSGS